MALAKTLLWVDDKIAELGPYVVALEEAGFTVMTADSTAGAMALAAKHHFDLALIDILMPPPDGIELLRRFHPVQPNTALAVLSSYLYLDKYRDQIRVLGFPVELLDKDIPHVEAPDFDARFLAPIRRLASEGVKNTVGSIEKVIASSTDNPFAIPLVDFMKKSIVEKDQLSLRARELAGPILNRQFEEGQIWVLLCGDSSTARRVARTPDKIPSEDEIMDYARTQQRAPFQFWKPVDVDDIWANCSARPDMKDYPTVTLDFEHDQVNLHFDTGSPWTFYSYEDLLGRELIKPTTQFALASRKGGGSYYTANLRVHAILRSQIDGASTGVWITGQAVRDWSTSPYVRFCDDTCTLQNRGDVCRGRSALIGRNLLTENRVVLILDGRVKKTALGGEK